MKQLPFLVQENPGAAAVAIADAEDILSTYHDTVPVLKDAGIYPYVCGYMAEHFLAFGYHVDPMIAVHRLGFWSFFGQSLDRLQGGVVIIQEAYEMDKFARAYRRSRKRVAA